RYDSGQGVERDVQQAIHWFRKAAEQGYAPAQFNLGLRFDKGDGVAQDSAAAIAWYERAATQGHASAQYNLALIHDGSHGGARDDAAAAVRALRAGACDYLTKPARRAELLGALEAAARAGGAAGRPRGGGVASSRPSRASAPRSSSTSSS
ncbi:MAG: tetratricopeptide repeat protein, partial [Gammaproteobacteria bacterium]